MKKYRKNNQHYTKKYFIERDHLSLHLLNAIDILLKRNGAKKVLEVGTGAGKMMKALQRKKYHVNGIDASPIAAKIAGGEVGSATKIPYKNKYDAIISINVIEHLYKKEGKLFIKEARRLLKQDGIIFLVTPNYASVLRLIFGKKWAGYVDKTHVFFYTPFSLKKLLEENGFYNVNFFFKLTTPVIEWPLPSFIHKLPDPLKLLINFLLATTPLALFIRDTFWISAKRKGNNVSE